MSVEEIVNAVRALPPEEQAELRRRLDALTAQHDETETLTDQRLQTSIDLDQRVQRVLFEAGLLSEIKPPITDPKPYRREPIKIVGKPLSETVIEERR